MLLALAVASCRREEHAPAPSSSASSAARDFAEKARESHFREELARARARFQSKPTLGDCAAALKEQADRALCEAAQSALSAITGDPSLAPEPVLAELAPGALALARLSERLRYLSLAELAERHVEADAGAAPARGASSAGPEMAAAARAHREQHANHTETRALQLSEGRLSQQLALTSRWERDVIRYLGAYLEYGPRPVRRAALDTAKRLRAEHPRWPLLDQLLQEASVLEVDDELHRELEQLSASDSVHGKTPAQSAGTK